MKKIKRWRSKKEHQLWEKCDNKSSLHM